MPEYKKPLWIVLGPKGRPVKFVLLPGAVATWSKKKEASRAAAYMNKTEKPGHHCVKVKRLEW